MRNTALFLTTALIGLLPALGFAQDAPATTNITPATTINADAPTSTPAPASARSFSDADRAAIEDIIKQYLTSKHPEVIMQGVQELQRREQESADTKTKEAITASKDKIYNDPNSPVGGNPKGDVTVVEFFDYQCPYCKSSDTSVQELLKNDKNVKFIYKEFPILGPASISASKAALASVAQGKYVAFHNALMAAHLSHNAKPVEEDEAVIYKTAKDVGLNVDKLKKDMGNDSVNKQIQATLSLGNDVGVRGTPMFIINDKTFPGALQPDQLRQAVDDARGGKK